MDEKLKERVVGASVLMLVAVIVIPMVLSGPAEDDETPAAPAKPAAAAPDSGFSSRIVPLGDAADLPAATSRPPPAGSAEEASPARADAQPAPKAEVKAPPLPVAKTAPRPAAEAAKPAVSSAPRKAAAPAAPKPGSGKGWVVQLGSFANPHNAHALRDRLKAKGYASFAVSSGSGKDAVTRVYVGPEAERSGAERHVASLLRETRLKGIVVRNPGG